MGTTTTTTTTSAPNHVVWEKGKQCCLSLNFIVYEFFSFFVVVNCKEIDSACGRNGLKRKAKKGTRQEGVFLVYFYILLINWIDFRKKENLRENQNIYKEK